MFKSSNRVSGAKRVISKTSVLQLVNNHGRPSSSIHHVCSPCKSAFVQADDFAIFETVRANENDLQMMQLRFKPQ